MCSLNLKQTADLTHQAAIESNIETRTNYFNQLVNGNFLHVRRSDKIADKVAVCISTICALAKEFELDWIAEKMYDRPKSEQRDYLCYAGAYFATPLLTLDALLCRVREAGRRTSVRNFQEQIMRFLGPSFPRGNDPRLLMIIYLSSACYGYELWRRRNRKFKGLHWRINATKSGRLLLVHRSPRRNRQDSYAVYKIPVFASYPSLRGFKVMSNY